MRSPLGYSVISTGRWGTAVSTGEGEVKSKRYVLRRLPKVATEVAERTDSGRLFQREGKHELNCHAPVLVLIVGMERVIPVFDLSEHDGSEVARSDGKR